MDYYANPDGLGFAELFATDEFICRRGGPATTPAQEREAPEENLIGAAFEEGAAHAS